MTFDYTQWAGSLAGSLVGGVLLALILRSIERRVRLVAYYGHVGTFRVQPTPPKLFLSTYTRTALSSKMLAGCPRTMFAYRTLFLSTRYPSMSPLSKA